ncbi:acetyl-CoA carboxylase biotin carboxyl carrier protein [Clostridium aciditolerans]|uniref:Biotin carboxyl carrier protein of acetyl-CoA carboxylase n=1 Tax=Clostridium aciditolerans TaxID=339861 RepID=A0A934M374_9CLOT|nr:acetyl-CoA carboxylase biotin carboxyl carrier protein [Clostridium aciditolerans]MBI6872877.1 acetyl-CoA carboxylase biotin carboxyl carrier protein [Clostridium aciditolerans]
MDFKAIEEMIKTVDNSKLGYLEVNWEGISIIMRKQGEPDFHKTIITNENTEKEVSNVVEESNKAEIVAEVKEPVKVAVEEVKEEEKIKIDDENIEKVASPIVGTFYSSPSPDKPSFVKVGSKVKKGDTLCIIEAMKLMNEIQSEVDGEVVEVLVENTQMVEYGQSMFKIRVNK